MIARRAYRVLPLNQLLLILIAALVVYLVLDFGRQVGVSRQRREELRQLEQKVEVANQEQAALENELVFATSPEAAEGWARINGLSREDEVLVVFVGASTAPSPELEAGAEVDASPSAPREAWWNLFFGSR